MKHAKETLTLTMRWRHSIAIGNFVEKLSLLKLLMLLNHVIFIIQKTQMKFPNKTMRDACCFLEQFHSKIPRNK